MNTRAKVRETNLRLGVGIKTRRRGEKKRKRIRMTKKWG